MYDKAYLVPTSNSYTLTAVNANVTGWSVKYNSNVWFDAGFVKK
ncbi:oligopeptide ABC transporter, oligopeptide-binding protein [Lactobacillus crispatus EM-LC1]|nr:oligopeptide ABC transporter, oligopeptide-binding protein [Lactobacillus crispatus EM-LC1]